MNRMYVTAKPPKVYTTQEEILSDYHAGKQFRAYGGKLVSKTDELKMRMATFTHVCFVWQDKDLQTRHYDMELK